VRRPWVAPLVLAVIALVATLNAVRVPGAARAGESTPAVRAAVLSPRRVPALLSSAVALARVQTVLDRVLANDEAPQSCLLVTAMGATVYTHDPDAALTPASTLKLLVAAAALARLGPDSHLTTRAVAAASADHGVVAGNVFLVGGGDPLLGTADYAASFKDQPRRYTDLNKLADDLVQKAGVKEIDGAVLGDESRYDSQRYVPTWKTVYATDGDAGPLSALLFNDDFVEWKPKVVPTPVPAGHAASVFTDMLKARGVIVNGTPAEGRAPSGGRMLASLDSLPIRELVGEMLVHSDNEGAELLTKELGHRFGGAGTTAAGVGVIRKTLTDAGVDMRAVVASDGSGLSPTDRITCRVLYSLLSGPSRAALLGAGLSVAGENGTMFDRFKNGNPAAGRLKGKTGTLQGVAGLAGVVDPKEPGGPGITFAFLANGLPLPSEERGKRLLERLGAALAAYPDAPAPAELAP
jgi:serine-type D-Ala-D-Ala carboxypeptidase/endopeptidase (penicillin-binding protein 4)